MIDAMKLMHTAGIPAVKIAEVHNISSATYQNVKKSGWNLDSYKELVNGQMKSWKVRRNETAKTVENNQPKRESELDVAYRKYYNVLTQLSSSIAELIIVLREHTERFDRVFPKSYNNNKGD